MGAPEKNMFMSVLGTFCPSYHMLQNRKFLHISHRHTSLTHDTKSMHHSIICFKSPSVDKCLACEMVLSEHRAEHPAVDDEAVVAEAALGG